MSESPKTGGEIDATCNRCKMLLGHTILAMVGSRVARVRCNTCQGEHNFHAPGATPRARSARAIAAASRGSARAEAIASASGGDLDTLLRGRDISQPSRYEPREAYEKDEILHHPSFGLGLVLAVRGERMDVLFPVGLKTLARHKGSGELPKRLADAHPKPQPEEGSTGEEP